MEDVDANVILLVVVDNWHVVCLAVEVTVDVVFLVVGVNGDVVFLDGDAVYDLRVVVPDGISHNTLTSPPLPPKKSTHVFLVFLIKAKKYLCHKTIYIYIYPFPLKVFFFQIWVK